MADKKQLFFSLDRAHFTDIHAFDKVIAVVIPVSMVRNKQEWPSQVLKKVLHKAFEPSEEERQSFYSASEAPPSVLAAGPLIVVDVQSIEFHFDTQRQVNANGDLQLNAMLGLTVARVRHGLIAGMAETSPYAECMLIRLSPDAYTLGADARTSLKRLRSTADDSASRAADAAPDTSAFYITVSCADSEPVVSGQAVLVISEPGGSIRCMAIRPPRRAPGPFKLSPVDGDKSGSKLQIECDMPPKDVSGGIKNNFSAKKE